MSTKKLARELGIIRKRRQNKESEQTKRHGSKQYFSYLIIIDFESTCWREKNNYGQEIIEFPAVLLNTSTGEVESEFHTYVQPQEHPVLSEFCTELTGITQTQVEGGVPLAICLSRFSRWLQALQQERGVAFLKGGRAAPLATGSPCAFVTWSDWDLGVCLLYECKRKQIHKPDALSCWIDLRATYKLFYSRKPKGLNGALQDLGIEFSGREHSGLDDARNTARLAWRMITDGCFMKVTKSLERAPLKTKPLFSNGSVPKAPSDQQQQQQQQQEPANNTETQHGTSRQPTGDKRPQSAATPSSDAATIGHTAHNNKLNIIPVITNNATLTTAISTNTTTTTYPMHTHGNNCPSTVSVRTNLPTSTTTSTYSNLPTTTNYNPLHTNTRTHPSSFSISSNLPAIGTNGYLPTTTTTINNPTTTTTNNTCQYQSLVTPKTVLNGSSSRNYNLYGASGGLIGSLTRQCPTNGGVRGHSSRQIGHSSTTGPSPRTRTAGTTAGLVLVSTALGSHSDLKPKQLNFDLEASSCSTDADTEYWADGVLLLPETEESGSYDDVVLEEEEFDVVGEGDDDVSVRNHDNGYNGSSYGNSSWQVTANRGVSWSGPGRITTSSRIYSTCETPTPAESVSLSVTSSKLICANTMSSVPQPPTASDDACFKKPRPVSAPSGGVKHRPLLRPFIHTTTTSPVGSSIPVSATPSYSGRNLSLSKTTLPRSLCATSCQQTACSISSASAMKRSVHQTASNGSNHSLHDIPASRSFVETNCKTSTISAVSVSNHSLYTSANSSSHCVINSCSTIIKNCTSGISSNQSLDSTSTSCTTNWRNSSATSGNSLLQQTLLRQNKTFHCSDDRKRQHVLELQTPATSRPFSVFQDVSVQPLHSSSTSSKSFSTSSKRTSTGGVSFLVPPTVLSSRINDQSRRDSSGLNKSRIGSGAGSGPAGKVTSPLCGCGRRAKRMTVGNGGPNHGRAFYCCPVRRSSGPGDAGASNKKSKRDGCGFFKWESALLVSVTPGGGMMKKKPFPGVGGTPNWSGKMMR